ncbi:MAG: TA system VapC family ribonuclease toxin [Verrucomicrobiales bacterium]
MPALCDVNLLLALCHGSHVHHARARQWAAGLGDHEAVLCRFTELALLRLSTTQTIFGLRVLTNHEAWALVDILLADPRFRFDDEPPEITVYLRRHSDVETPAPKRWQDAYLAAFAIAADLDFVTFDGGFRSFSGLRATVLTESTSSS